MIFYISFYIIFSIHGMLNNKKNQSHDNDSGTLIKYDLEHLFHNQNFLINSSLMRNQ